MAVSKSPRKIYLFRKGVPDSSSKNYGIPVARFAWLLQKVIERAIDILTQIEKQGKIQFSSEKIG